MEIESKQITLRKLVASKGKYLREKSFQEETVDENGIIEKHTPDFATVVYLAANASEDSYEELDMPSEKAKQKLKEKNEKFNQEQREAYEKKIREEEESLIKSKYDEEDEE